MILENIQETATKYCTRCKVEKDQSAFSKNRSCRDGLQSWCRSCKAEQQRSTAGKESSKKSSAKWSRTSAGIESNKKAGTKKYSTIRGHLQKIFTNMNQRCNNPDCPGYKYYGARGIKVCFASSEVFINYVVGVLKVDPRGLTIDRINNDGNYESGNIRFVTNLENQQNKRPRKKKSKAAQRIKPIEENLK